MRGAIRVFEAKEPIGDVLVPFRWDLLGFGFCRAWVTGYLAYSANEIWTSGASLGLQVALYLTAAIVAAIVALLSKRMMPDRVAGMAVPAVGAFAAIGTLGMACVMLGKLDAIDALFYFGFVLIGACCGFFETVWGIKFTKLPPSGIQIYTLFVMAVSSLLGIAMGLLPSSAFFIVSLVLFGAMAFLLLAKPSGSMLAAEASSKNDTDSDSAAGEARMRSGRALANVLLSCLVFSLIYNLVVSITYDALPSEMASQIRFWANLLAALILLCTFLLIKPLSAVSLFRLILPITAVGFVLYLISPAAFGEIALMISGVGRKFFDILTWILVARTVQVFGFSPLRYFGFLTAAKNLGYAFGLVFASVALGALDAQVIQIATFVPILLLALIVCFFWLFPERTIDNLFNTLPSSGSALSYEATMEENARALAKKRGLTPRETEVLMLMAKGRNLSVIMAKLHISKGTAHTHMTHVYQKLGVHGQQELIGLVEEPGDS